MGDFNPFANQNKTPPSAAALRRIKKEMENFIKEPVEGIHFLLDDDEANLVHALVVGPPETPYEGGFFYFLLRMPPDYPFKPPMVKLMTTGNSSVRFNPNLYNSGRVCLSILGTWPGPSWTPNLTIRSVLLSIQSLLNKEPYFNEPGYEGSRKTPLGQKASTEYNQNILFQTMRVATIGMMEPSNLESTSMPQALKDTMAAIFISKIDFYAAVLLQNEEDTKFKDNNLQERFNKLVEDSNSKGKEAGKKAAATQGGGEEEGSSAAKKAKKGKKAVKT